MINRVVAIFSGFTEGLSSGGNGCADLYDCAADLYAAKGTRVSLDTWDADTSDLALHLWQRMDREKCRIAIVGYSYGANAAVRLAKRLVECGMDRIDLVALCDPVVRWNSLPGVAAWFGLGSFSLPSEVRKLVLASQANPRQSFRRWLAGGHYFEPAAHPVLTLPATERRVVTVPPHVSHRRLDESARVIDAVISEIDLLFREVA